MSKEKQKELENKQKAIASVMSQIEKDFGVGSIMKLGDEGAKVNVDTVSTGSLKINQALGINGLPYGRIVEIYGPESSGKTTLTLETIAEAQKDGKICAFIDAEHALDPSYAKKLGINLDDLIISQPDSGEQALEIVDKLARSAAIDIIIVDSVAALTPKAELEGNMGDSHMGLQARLMSQALRKLTGTLKQTNTLCIFINQIRSKIGVMFGSPETTTGGNALKFYASIRIDIRRTGSEKNSEQEIISNTTKVKIVKNKLAPPFREAITSIKFGEGFDIYSEYLDFATEMNFVNKAGSWYSFQDAKIGQGKDNVIKGFKGENIEIYEKIKSMVDEELTKKS